MPATKNLITLMRVNAAKDGFDIYYPKTIASQVVYDAAGHTLQDHVNDTDIHLSASERTALTNVNQANGYLQLDGNGYVPSSNLNPSVLAVSIEFDNINDLTDTTRNGNVAPGQLVMVVDASDDPTVTSGWAIYRRLSSAVDLSQLASWQKIAENESMDLVLNWANLADKPSSLVADIDDAVTKRHEHANKAALDLLNGSASDAAVVSLSYNGFALSFEKDVTTFTVADAENLPTASSLKTGDFVLAVSGTTNL